MIIKTLILSGDGINCELETAYAFKKAGAQVTVMPVTDFLEMPNLEDFHILVFPGGFSFGDEVRSGKILAEKIKTCKLKELKEFIAQGKPILGICNGFQILTQLGVFDNFELRHTTLSENDHGKFINKWIELHIADTNNIWLKNLPKTIMLPIRHKEGKVKVNGNLQANIALTYEENLNGSFQNIAGLTNSKGNVLGLMPHPEAAISNLLLPHHKNKNASDNISLLIFKNAVNYCKGIEHAN